MKIYEIDFEGVYPVPSGCIIAANDEDEAMKIARETITHVAVEGIKEIDISKPRVVFYASGDY